MKRIQPSKQKNISNIPIPKTGAKTISLFSQPYLDTYNQCYKNIIVANMKPQGPFGDLVRVVNFPQLSSFKQNTPCNPIKQCGYAVFLFDDCINGCAKYGNDLMTTDDIPNLISYLTMNGYSIDTSITNMFNNGDIKFNQNVGNELICFVTYNG